jgi:hypothetical protein
VLSRREGTHSAKVLDQEGVKPLLERSKEQFLSLKHLWVDSGYKGKDKGKGWIEKVLGWTVEIVEKLRKKPLLHRKC